MKSFQKSRNGTNHSKTLSVAESEDKESFMSFDPIRERS